MDTVDYSEEIWKDVVGWEGLYEVSESGQIRRIFHAQNQWINQTGIKHFIGPKGYHTVHLQRPNKRVTVHKIVAEAFICPKVGRLQVNHKDGNKSHNHWKNLEWLTAKGNADHAMALGLWVNKIKRGTANGNTPLSDAQVIAIRRRAACGESFRAIGVIYNISATTAHRRARRKVWTHI